MPVKTTRKTSKASTRSKTTRKTSKASTGSKYVLKITTVTRTTPADRATILKLKAATQAELKRRGAKNVKVEVVKV